MQTFLFLPTVHTGLLRLGHGHSPHAVIRMEPCLWLFPVPFLPAPHFCIGADPPTPRAAGPPGSSPALHVQRAQKDPPRLEEDPTHPLHSAGGCQPRVRVAAVQEWTLCCVVGGSSQFQLKNYRCGLPNRIIKIFALCIIFNLCCFVISNEQMHLLSDVLISFAFPAEIVSSHRSLTFFKMLKKDWTARFVFRGIDHLKILKSARNDQLT